MEEIKYQETKHIYVHTQDHFTELWVHICNCPLDMTNDHAQLSFTVVCTKSLKVNADLHFLSYPHILLVLTICPESNQF